MRLLLTVMALGLAACSKQTPDGAPARPSASRTFEVKGILRGAPDPVQRQVLVQHEDIPGFMPGMTMLFGFLDPGEMAGLDAGDAIAFKLVVTEQTSWMTDIRRIDAAEVRLPSQPTSKPAAAGVTRLREGDRLPDFDLVDQAGRVLRRETFAGKALVATFIFTRCPIPDFCPLMSRNFRTIQEEVRADPGLAGKVGLLSISFDEYDTPAVLADYAATFSDDPDSWRFATGRPEEVQKLTRAFAVHIEQEDGTISHGLATALIGPDGVIRQIWRGNAWKPAEVLAALHALPYPGQQHHHAGLDTHQ